MEFNEGAIAAINEQVIGPFRELFILKDSYDKPFELNLCVRKNKEEISVRGLEYLEFAEELMKIKDTKTYEMWKEIKELLTSLEKTVEDLKLSVKDVIKEKMKEHYPRLKEFVDYNLPNNSYRILELSNIIWRNFMRSPINPAIFYTAESGDAHVFCETAPKSGYSSYRTDIDLIKSDRNVEVDRDKNLEILNSIISDRGITQDFYAFVNNRNALDSKLGDFKNEIKRLHARLELKL